MKATLVLSFLLISWCVSAQFNHQDSLRGGYGPTRDWWDVTHYDLSVEFDLEKKEIKGKNVISIQSFSEYRMNEVHVVQKMQIDLQDPMILDKIELGGTAIDMKTVKKDGNAYIFDPGHLRSDTTYKLTVYYHGSPHVAKNAPWDGGIIWTQDQNGNPWTTIACQGFGASSWYPCKDSQYDEPDSASMHFTVPDKLVCVSNGVFMGKKELPGNKAEYSWKVSNPINTYNIIPYIGDYVNIHEHYNGEKGTLELDYWVIRGNEEKAKKQFQDAPRTLEALEYWFGPYPFYEDGYKLVESPHLGMEHQSAVAYGNKYQNGYRGTDLSGTGEGLKWDFIIVHESGHEWFGNNVTSQDIADMWIHESFTNYSETLFMDYWFGKESANKYVCGLRKNIENDKPIIGPYGVNTEGSGDMYYKGSNMLHTIRQIVNNDSLFRDVLRDINETFWHQTVSTQMIEEFMSSMLNLDLSKTFDQYLRTKQIPTLELSYSDTKIKYRWSNCIKGFNMPVQLGGQRLYPTTKWQTFTVEDYKHFCPNEQLYINYVIKQSKSFKQNANNFAVDFSCLKNITQANGKK